MVDKMIKIGMIGISEGNGHPYSFSAIINGYDKKAMKKSGWKVIYDYLNLRDKSDFLFENAKVTHVWTQDLEESKKISKATKIKNVCKDYKDMISKVDAVIIARDDYETHYEIAKPFLEAGLTVFVDKPLSLDKKELKFFLPYLKEHKLMSCGGVRYCRELDDIRANISEFKNLKLIRAAVVNSWEKYGIHMLDGIFSVVKFDVKSVLAIDGKHMSVVLKNNDKSLIQIDALNQTYKTFQFDFWSENKKFTAEVEDNFSSFRRLLYHFINMIQTGKSEINPELTINLMKVLIAARISQKENKEVFLDEVII